MTYINENDRVILPNGNVGTACVILGANRAGNDRVVIVREDGASHTQGYRHDQLTPIRDKTTNF